MDQLQRPGRRDVLPVERSTNGGSTWTRVDNLGSNSAADLDDVHDPLPVYFFIDQEFSGISQGTNVVYRIRAVNAAGNSSYSATTATVQRP
jgi:hypothetical protein